MYNVNMHVYVLYITYTCTCIGNVYVNTIKLVRGETSDSSWHTT